VLLILFTTLVAPSLAEGIAPAGSPSEHEQQGSTPPSTRTDQHGRSEGWVPGAGKASSPYDREALRNFDAGSHR
jgi:hypothetical protein